MHSYYNGPFANGSFFGSEGSEGLAGCPQTSFFGGSFYCGNFFDDTEAPTPPPAEEAVKTGTGGIDKGDARRRIFKPTGLLRLPKKRGGNKIVEDRLQDAQLAQAEIAAQLAREFAEDGAAIAAQPPVVDMTLAQVEAEIGMILRKKLRTEEDEVLLLLLMAAAAA